MLHRADPGPGAGRGELRLCSARLCPGTGGPVRRHGGRVHARAQRRRGGHRPGAAGGPGGGPARRSGAGRTLYCRRRGPHSQPDGAAGQKAAAGHRDPGRLLQQPHGHPGPQPGPARPGTVPRGGPRLGRPHGRAGRGRGHPHPRPRPRRAGGGPGKGGAGGPAGPGSGAAAGPAQHHAGRAHRGGLRQHRRHRRAGAGQRPGRGGASGCSARSSSISTAAIIPPKRSSSQPTARRWNTLLPGVWWCAPAISAPTRR